MGYDMNDVPMQGLGQYSSNAALQNEAMLKALPLIQRAARQSKAKNRNSCPRRVTVIEYGSAHGNNS